MADALDDLWSRIRRHADRFGHGHWRLPDDPVDLAWEITIDRSLDAAHRESVDRLEAYALQVFENLVRKGPSRAICDRRRTGILPDEFACAHSAGEPPLRNRVVLPSNLTAAERSAVEAVKTHDSHASAAVHCGMSARDLRTRLRRAIAKIRAELA